MNISVTYLHESGQVYNREGYVFVLFLRLFIFVFVFKKCCTDLNQIFRVDRLWTSSKKDSIFSTLVHMSREGCPETWWDCVMNDMESLGLSQKDAQSRNKWRRRNKGATG